MTVTGKLKALVKIRRGLDINVQTKKELVDFSYIIDWDNDPLCVSLFKSRPCKKSCRNHIDFRSVFCIGHSHYTSVYCISDRFHSIYRIYSPNKTKASSLYWQDLCD